MNKELSFNFCFSIENSFWHVLRKWYFRNLCRTLWCVLKDQLIDMKIIRKSTTSDFFMLRAILIGIVAKNFWIYICSWWKSIGPYQGLVLTTFLLKQMSRFCFRMWHILLMMKDVYKLSNWTCSSGKIFLYARNNFLISCTAFKGLVLFAFYSYVNKPLGNKDR